MNKVSVVIADDERGAREELKRLLATYEEYEIVAEGTSTMQVQEQIVTLQPSLVFLDIQMPGPSVFEMLETLENVPEVIFITAHDKYAVQAFESNALDYLLKPVREERFARAIQKAAKRLLTEKGNPEQIFIKDGSHYHFIRWKDVYLIESADNYARLYTGDKKVLYKTSLNQLEQKLNADSFFRANRAQIVNLQFIEHANTLPDSRIELILLTGEQIILSERQSVKFRNR